MYGVIGLLDIVYLPSFSFFCFMNQFYCIFFISAGRRNGNKQYSLQCRIVYIPKLKISDLHMLKTSSYVVHRVTMFTSYHLRL